MLKALHGAFKCRHTAKCLLRVVIGGLALVLGLSQLWLIWLQRGHHGDATHIRSRAVSVPTVRSKSKSYDYSEKLELRVLLQHSPVNQIEQHLRLRAIDNGWAGWDTNLERSRKSDTSTDTEHANIVMNTIHGGYHLKVYAAIFPQDAPLYRGARALRNIQTIQVHADPENGDEPPTAKRKTIADSPTAMQRMVDSFLWVLTSDSDSDGGGGGAMKWLVFANDHSFIIPPNLAFTLEGMSPESVVYTGNMIGMQKTKDLEIFFASGGAGAVLSHTALKCAILSWVLLQPERMEEALCHLGCHQAQRVWSHPGQPESAESGQPASRSEAADASDMLNCMGQIRDAFRSQLHEGQDPRNDVGVVDWSGSVGADDVAALLHWKAWSLMKKGPITYRHQSSQSNGHESSRGHTRDRDRDRGADHSDPESESDPEGGGDVPTEIEIIVSSKVSVFVSFDHDHSLYLSVVSRSNSTASTAAASTTDHTQYDLDKNCLDNSKWGQVNPGISLARCLKAVFQSSSPETRWDTTMLEGSKSSSVESGSVVTSSTASGSTAAHRSGRELRERFNVYGPVRTSLGDFDQWYAEKKPDEGGVILQNGELDDNGGQEEKQDQVQGQEQEHGQMQAPFSPIPLVSFHYVSQHETEFLYSLLYRRSISRFGSVLQPLTAAVKYNNPECPKHYAYQEFLKQHFARNGSHSWYIPEADAESITDYKILLQRWYTNQHPEGSYSRKLRSLQEAKRLYRLLYCDIIIL